LELIAEFDEFLAQHIRQYGNKGSGQISYLSKTTYKEYLIVMAEEVCRTTTEGIKVSNYFSIIL
jgi:hypothetical protein